MGEDDVVTFDEEDSPQAGAGTTVPEPVPFGLDDVVPRFRTDLHVARGASPALFDVSDPRTGRKFTLYEFELAVARMLDGRRRVSEVVASGGRLGVPMDARSLYKFVRQMWHYGFLAAGPEAGAGDGQGAGEDGTWDDREQWDEATRTLFQTGQRLMRLGRNADAAGYFEAVLDARPANAEAAEMLALIARGQSLAAAPLGEVRPGGAASVAAPPATGPAAPPSQPVAPRRTAPIVIGVAVVLLLAGGGAVALRYRARAVPAPETPAATPVAPPAPAQATPPSAPAEAAWRTAKVERRTHPVLAELVAPADGDLVWSGAPDAKVAKGERLGTLRMVVAAGRKDAALARRVAELEALAAKDPVYRDFLDKARKDLRRAESRRETRSVELAAPAAGVLARAPEMRGRAASGERLARILDPDVWQLAFALDGPELAADAVCEVVGDVPADRVACRLAARAGDRSEMLAEVAAADAPWLARAASLWIRVGSGSPPALRAAPGARPDGAGGPP